MSLILLGNSRLQLITLLDIVIKKPASIWKETHKKYGQENLPKTHYRWCFKRMLLTALEHYLDVWESLDRLTATRGHTNNIDGAILPIWNSSMLFQINMSSCQQHSRMFLLVLNWLLLRGLSLQGNPQFSLYNIVHIKTKYYHN